MGGSNNEVARICMGLKDKGSRLSNKLDEGSERKEFTITPRFSFE